MIGTPEENEKLIEERIVSLRRQIADEQAKTHERLQQIEEDYEQRRRYALRDSWDRAEPMRRELEELLKVMTAKHAFSTVPPVIVLSTEVDKDLAAELNRER